MTMTNNFHSTRHTVIAPEDKRAYVYTLHSNYPLGFDHGTEHGELVVRAFGNGATTRAGRACSQKSRDGQTTFMLVLNEVRDGNGDIVVTTDRADRNRARKK